MSHERIRIILYMPLILSNLAYNTFLCALWYSDITAFKIAPHRSNMEEFENPRHLISDRGSFVRLFCVRGGFDIIESR